nr:UPF0481 protein At3g47200-like [Ipomoea batatas]
MADSYTGTTSDCSDLPDLTTTEIAEHEDPEKPLLAAWARSHQGYQEIEISSSCYKPSLVSIGPKYSKDVDQVKDKEYKNMYMNSFLERAMGLSVEEYGEYLKNSEMKLLDKAQNYYKENGITYPNNDEELVDMLLLDGCFVVEFVLKCKEGGNGDPRGSIEGKKARKDMLLFENQLPFDVLSAIYEKMTTSNTDEVPSFIRLVKFAFASLAPKFTINNFHDDNKPEQPMDLLHVEDLLHVVYSLCLPRNAQTLISQAAKGNEENVWLKLNHMNSATKLKEVGVGFYKTGLVYHMPKKYENIPSPEFTGAISLFDITFHNGAMTIPCFKVDNFTELFFRNMIALEQRCDALNPKYFTDYARLMDHLLDTNRDVSLLRKNGIIQNLLDEDRKVAYIFNNLMNGEVDTPSTNFYFASVYKDVDEHYSRYSYCYYWNQPGACDRVLKVVATLLIAVPLLIIAATKTLLLQGDHVSEEEFSGVIDFDTRDDFKRELILEQEHVFASFLPFNAIARITIAAFLAFQNKLHHKATVKHQHFYQLFIVLGIDVFECPTALLDFKYLFLYSLSLT